MIGAGKLKSKKYVAHVIKYSQRTSSNITALNIHYLVVASVITVVGL